MNAPAELDELVLLCASITWPGVWTEVSAVGEASCGRRVSVRDGSVTREARTREVSVKTVSTFEPPGLHTLSALNGAGGPVVERTTRCRHLPGTAIQSE